MSWLCYLSLAAMAFVLGIILVWWLASLIGTTPPVRVKHVKRGSTYEIIGMAQIQTDTPLNDYDQVFVYRDPETDEIWVRPSSEFNDGRFVVIK